MIIKFFIVFSLLIFTLSILHATFSIVFKHEFRYVNKAIDSIRENKSLAPVIILLIVFIIFLILNLLVSTDSFTHCYDKFTSNGNTIGSIGDFFNGLVAPTISIISIIYLWKAFVQQFKANQMLYRFEIERSFKSDIEWLRSNHSDLVMLENELLNKQNTFIYNHLQKPNKVRKCIYLMNVIEKLNLDLKNKKSKEFDFTEVENDIKMILESLYLPSLKNLYRVFGNYLKSRLDSGESEIIDLQSLEAQFMISFFRFYESSDIRQDNLFDMSYITFKKLFL